MSFMKKILFVLLIISFQGFADVYQFLKLQPSPRATSIGNGFIANYDDPNVIFSNPAGLFGIEKYRTSFSFVSYLSDIKFTSLTTSFNDKQFNYGVGLIAVDYGKIDRYDEFANSLGTFNPVDIAIYFGLSAKMDDNFYYGGNAKFIYSKIENYSSTGISFDFGINYLNNTKELNLSLVLKDIGFQLSTYSGKRENLPFNIQIGGNYKLRGVPANIYFAVDNITNSMSFIKHLEKISIGTEIKLGKIITTRFSYDNSKRKDLMINNTAGLAGFNFGIGINVKNYVIDYSYSSYGKIGGVNKFGLTTTF